MPDGSQFLVFVGAAVTLLLIPGPAVAFIVAPRSSSVDVPAVPRRFP